jgi:hypothetical protein
MSDFKGMNMIFKAIVPNLQKSGIPVTYMRYTLDELVFLDRDIDFHETLSYDVRHHWFAEGNQQLQAYSGIVNWIAGTER